MAGLTSAAGLGAAGSAGISALSAMNPYMAAISAVGPLARGIYGIAQKAKANKMRDEFDQPIYNIPGAQTEALGLARSLAYDPSLPGQQMIEAGMDRGLATGNRAIMEAGMSGAERLAAINAGVGNRLDANAQLAQQMAAQQNADIAALQGQLGTMAGYQDKRWQLNEQQPWMDAMEAANRLDEGGAQNMFGALNDITGLGAATITKGETSGAGTTGAKVAAGTGAGTVPVQPAARTAPAGATTARGGGEMLADMSPYGRLGTTEFPTPDVIQQPSTGLGITQFPTPSVRPSTPETFPTGMPGKKGGLGSDGRTTFSSNLPAKDKFDLMKTLGMNIMGGFR